MPKTTIVKPFPNIIYPIIIYLKTICSCQAQFKQAISVEIELSWPTYTSAILTRYNKVVSILGIKAVSHAASG